YDSALFHTVHCECNEVSDIHQSNDWILTKDDGCCKEVLIFAHNISNFHSTHWLLQVIVSLISILLTFYLFIFHKIVLDASYVFYKYFKRSFSICLVYLLFHLKLVRTFILRN
ncbi:MAG: hypothetical protein N2203_07760, partial [Bacteroidia bacterium]|nr:hypothetical protein [Bacteroidia bacterium]